MRLPREQRIQLNELAGALVIEAIYEGVTYDDFEEYTGVEAYRLKELVEGVRLLNTDTVLGIIHWLIGETEIVEEADLELLDIITGGVR